MEVKMTKQNISLRRNQKGSRHLLASFFVAISVMAAGAPLCAQEKNDDALLDQMIRTKKGSTIVFNQKNIKQFWISNNVMSQKDYFSVLLTQDSNPLKIQLANVNESLDCQIEAICDTSDVSFSVYNSKMAKIGESKQEEDFISFHVFSSTFHLEDTDDSSFSLKFASKSSEIKIRRIVLSFSANSNSSFLSSPGKLRFLKDNSTVDGKYDFDDNGVLTASGKEVRWTSSKKIFVSDNTFSSTVKVKNTGDSPVRVYIGYSPYQRNHTRIDNRCAPFNNKNKILKVISSNKNTDKIIVDSMPEWKEGCFLALDAKEDLSDFPNYSFAGRISKVEQKDNGQAEITINSPLKNALSEGTSLRVQNSYGYTDLYVTVKVLQPGEEETVDYSIKKDDNFFQYSPTAFCKGVYYVVPLINFGSVDPEKEISVQISNYSIEY